MIKELIIKNLVLMEDCKISFDEKFSALTGETGAGKTAVLHSLKLLLGQKLDTSLIRFGCLKGSIKALFSFSSPQLTLLLSEAEIDIEENNLTLYREVSADGKSKSFINDRLVPLSFLQKISSHLIQIVDQSSYMELRQTENQRHLLDSFGDLQNEVNFFSGRFEELKRLKLEKETLEERDRQKERELNFCKSQEKELSSFSLEEGEEDLLFQEYSLINKSQEIAEKTDEIFTILNAPPYSLISSLDRCRSLCSSLSKTHETFEESERLLKEASYPIQEALCLLRQALGTFDPNPRRLQFLEEKLSLIDKMKKKYGPSPSSWENYLVKLQEKISLFENLEEDQRVLEENLILLEKELQELGEKLSAKRKSAAQKLSLKLHSELKDLNMGSAELEIRIEPQPRSTNGEDKISFWLKTNPGEAPSNVKDSSSGGELSRLLLAFKLALAEKNSTPTLIFDEIDANVGGETARMIGEKLLKLSSDRQIICITHFPQVACQAHLHLKVQKSASSEKTTATIEPLSDKFREQELLRMLGGKKDLVKGL
jgi:DNA repair protein RecN (Recombination protein N)